MSQPIVSHPIVAVVSDIRALLKGVAGANPTFLTVEEKATALCELVRAEGQLAELRLRVLADAGDLADSTGAKDAAGWLAHRTRTRFTDARADLALATALDRDRPVLAAGMRDGTVTVAQAHVIRRALDALPAPGRPRHRGTGGGEAGRRTPRSSGPRSSAASAAGSSTPSPPRSPSRPKPTGSRTSKPMPPTRPG